MTWYNGQGRTCGRVLQAVELYLGLPIAERVQFEDPSQLLLHGKPIGRYTWEGDDKPVLTFTPFQGLSDDQIRTANQNQYYLSFYLDEPLLKDFVRYTVQEIKKVISLWEAEYLIWVRDFWKGDWTQPIKTQEAENMEMKIKAIITSSSHGYLVPEYRDQWRHLAMCAVWEWSKRL